MFEKRWQRLPYILIVLLGCLLSGAVHAGEVSFSESESSLEILVDGEPVATYVWRDELIPRPHWKQVVAPNGKQVTRRYPTDPVLNKGNDDHATYHPGMWLAFGDINGNDFWRNKASVRHVKFIEAPRVEGSSVTFTVQNVYQSGETTVCYERCSVVFRVSSVGYLFSLRSTFTSEAAFAFGDQEEMGFGVRMATKLNVRHGNGAIKNSEGGRNERGTWGHTAKWCAYSGVLDGQRTGIMLIPHATNFRPSWYHSRDYGLLVANPFGKKAMTGPDDNDVAPDSTRVRANEEFVIGFNVLVFGETDAKEVNYRKAYRSVTSVQ